jgi:hypothetical protein
LAVSSQVGFFCIGCSTPRGLPSDTMAVPGSGNCSMSSLRSKFWKPYPKVLSALLDASILPTGASFTVLVCVLDESLEHLRSAPTALSKALSR